MSDNDEKIQYGFDIDNSGFKQGVDDAFDHLDKKEQEAISKVANTAKQVENKVKGVNSEVKRDTLDTVDKVMQYLHMSESEAIAYLDKRKAKNKEVLDDTVSQTKKAEQQKTRVVQEENKKRVLSEQEAEKQLEAIFDTTDKQKKAINSAKNVAKKVSNKASTIARAGKTNEYEAQSSAVGSKNTYTKDAKHTPNIAAERFVKGGVTDKYYDQTIGGMRTGSPTFRGDPVGNGWGSRDPRLDNMGAYKEANYISQHPERMSRRELSAHLVKLNYQKKLEQQAKARPMTDAEEFKFQNDKDSMNAWKDANFWNMVKGRAKVLKEQTKKQTEDFYDSFAKLNNMTMEEAKSYIGRAQKNMPKPSSKSTTQNTSSEVVDTKQLSGLDKVTAALNRHAENIDRLVKTLTEGRVEKYYNNKEADENSKLNKQLYKGRKVTPEQLQDIYTNNAVKYARSAAKYAKNPEQFDSMIADIQQVLNGGKEGFKASEVYQKELTYLKDMVAKRTKDTSRDDEMDDARRKQAATQLINDAIATSKSLEELTAALEHAANVATGKAPVPNKGDSRYSTAVNKAQSILSGTKKLPMIGKKLAPNAEDEAAIDGYKKSVGNIGTVYTKLQDKVDKFFHGGAEAAKEASEKTYNYFKSATRIASGILISQAFYTAINAIKQGISAINEFNNKMEDTQVGMTQLLGSAKAAKAFMYDVEDVAAETPYSIDTAVDTSKRLLAYGFKAKEVIPTLRTLADATAITGDSPEKMERLTLALGQIKVKGKLAGQELRQLYDAGIPAADIMMKGLNLNRAEFDKSVSKGEISANKAITILLKGIEDRFGGTAKKLNQTVNGLMSNIKDNLSFMGQQLFGSLHDQFRDSLQGVADKLAELRKVSRAQGGGGLLNAVIPKDFQDDARRALAYIQMIGRSIKGIFVSSGSLRYVALGLLRGSLLVLGPLGSALTFVDNTIKAINKHVNILKPLLTAVGMMMSVKMLFGVASGLGTLLLRLSKIIGLTGGVKGVGLAFEAVFRLITRQGKVAASALEGVGVATKFLVSNPIILLIGGIAIAVYQLGKHADDLKAKVMSVTSAIGMGGLGRVIGVVLDVFNGAFKVMSWILSTIGSMIDKIFGIDISKILQPTQDGIDGLGDAMSGYTDNVDDATDSTDALTDATKKFLASFDEVHQIEDEAGDLGGGSGGGPSGGLDESNDPGDKKDKNTIPLPKIDWNKLIPPPPKLKWPDVTPPSTTQVKAAFDEVVEWVKKKWSELNSLVPVHLPIPTFNPLIGAVTTGVIAVQAAWGRLLLPNPLIPNPNFAPLLSNFDVNVNAARNKWNELQSLLVPHIPLPSFAALITAFNVAVSQARGIYAQLQSLPAIRVPSPDLSNIPNGFRSALSEAGDVLRSFRPTFKFNPLELVAGALTAGAVLFKNLTGRWTVPGYASGGIIDKDQIIRAGEGGRREAVVPLENDDAMAPFARAVAGYLDKGTPSQSSNLRPLYVGTLIADRQGLVELNKQMTIIESQESGRRY